MKKADRWFSPEHKCPFCGWIQFDGWSKSGGTWKCKLCGKKYLLPTNNEAMPEGWKRDENTN